MKLDFSAPPAFGTTRLPRFPGWLVALGPGIIWMALAQGSGELIWWPYLMAKYGLGFLCLLIPACLLQYPLTFEIGRYTAMTGESIWRGFVRLNPIFAFVLWILMLISFLWFGAFASAGGTAMAELTQWPAGFDAKHRTLFWAGLTIAVFAYALLTRKKTYKLIERVMWLVSISTLFGLMVSCLNAEVRPVAGDFLRAIVEPRPLSRPWDSKDLDKFLTALTFAGLGGFWTLFYSYWILGKGIACASEYPQKSGCVPAEAEEGDLEKAARTWRRFIIADAGIGIVGNILTTLMMCLLAYAILHPKGIVPAGWTLAVEQSRFFEVSWGAFGRALFLIISAAFLADTWLSTADAVANIHIEMIRFYFFRGEPYDHLTWYRGMVVLLTAVTGITMLADQPENLIILSAILGFIGTVIFTAAILVLIHGPFRRALPDPIKPGTASFVCLSISMIAYTLLAVAYLTATFWPEKLSRFF